MLSLGFQPKPVNCTLCVGNEAANGQNELRLPAEAQSGEAKRILALLTGEIIANCGEKVGTSVY